MIKDDSLPAADLPDHPIEGSSTATAAGLYIHVPFCQAKCPYCDFYSVTQLDLVDTYIEALLAEVKRYRNRIPFADTIYLGGGTPSILTPRQIAQVLDGVQNCFCVAAHAEVTLEVNPGTVSRDSLVDFRHAGVNRLNIGLQSTDDRSLALLGRIHSAQTGIDTYHHARASGFDNVGLDLIYAIPGQTRLRWEAEMAGVVRLAPDHLSCYTLTIESGTPIARQVQDNQFQALDEKTVADLFCATADYLNGNGYRQYEISNFARHVSGAPDRRSRHNRKYWTHAPYLGFGPSAHSFMGNRRWWNHRDLARYLSTLKEGIRPVAGSEELNYDQQVIEFVYLGLRQTDGIDTADFALRFNTDFSAHFSAQLSALCAEGLIEEASLGRIRLTQRGMRFLESVVDRLLSDAG